jgi:hypothetical protein
MSQKAFIFRFNINLAIRLILTTIMEIELKLLTEIIDVNELYRIKILFESKGVAIFVSNEDSARNMGFTYPARKYGVFVIYEEQFEDAYNLLNDELYEVNNPIDIVKHREQLESEQQIKSNQLFEKLMNAIMVSIAITIGGVFIYRTWFMPL